MMLLTDAITLIDTGLLHTEVEHWADLGCGSGLFTRALTTKLKAGSLITAIDKNGESLKKSAGVYNGVTVKTLQEDFTKAIFPDLLDGILMANALHYVPEQEIFTGYLKTLLKKEGLVIIVEYDTDKANPWVPYPVNYSKLARLFREQGFGDVELLGRQPSVYGASMYSVIIKNGI